MSISRGISIVAVLFLICQAPLAAQNKRLISGSVIDMTTKEPLPYVTVSLKKQLIGVVTNEEGKFDLYVPKEVESDTLLVNYLGYKHFLMNIAEIKEPITIKLEQTVVELEEIVIRPLSPENYIQMAMRKINANYPREPFLTDAYYREKLRENNNLIKCEEGLFKTYYKSLLDTVNTQNQLLLYRQTDSSQKLVFMNNLRKKKAKKDSLERLNNKDAKPDSSVTLDVGGSFGGPAKILKNGSIGNDPEPFLDSLQFKSYKYSFAKSSSYNTNELMVIDFSSKGKVNHLREQGKIYIDLNSLAIVKLEWNGNLIIPGFIKPIFFVLGVRLKNPTFEKTIEFQQVNGVWYPENIQLYTYLKFTDKHMFRKDDHSDFEIEQFFTVNKLQTENPVEIPEAKRFVEKKEMQKQVFNDEGLTWEGLNIIKK